MAIELIAKIKPKNGGNFAMVDAEDIAYKDGRLPDYMPVWLTQEEYDALDEISPTTPYFIYEQETEEEEEEEASA